MGEINKAGGVDFNFLVGIIFCDIDNGIMFSGEIKTARGGAFVNRQPERIKNREGEVVGFGGAGGDDEMGAFGADAVGDGIFGGFVVGADLLGWEIGGGGIKKKFGKIGRHGAEGGF